MENAELQKMLDRARLCLADVDRSANPVGSGKPRFVLFHAAMSFCSQKVRATLAQRGAAYESNEMLILGRREANGLLIPAENYSPDYVRLRLRGQGAGSVGLAQAYSGISSVSEVGLDACAVPTLVDLETSEVVVDSLRICIHIDAVAGGNDRLIPTDPVQLQIVRRQLRAVDVTPHPGLLYGFPQNADLRPDPLKKAMSTVYEEKVEALRALLSQNIGDPELVEAYRAKIAKEAGGLNLRYDFAFQDSLRASARRIVEQLASDLEGAGTGWLCGPSLTLADIFWAVSLTRLQYLGLGRLWVDFPAVAAYVDRLHELPSVQEEIIMATRRSMPESKYIRSLV
ncbi:glutathione S-transferase family protein [Rhizobium sp. CECT 9324]|uniref:glutathione S-transferase family protein n=1 Tax=Rhizobium sp. CECT 9324 TaxID=2845820 RepID=UPI001E5B4678|nr:glutathione S-transferase family protein [Rhizobium sp. CECT 9324]CAH0340835.1 2,5-dichlorohydroquinone reductive dechlorinase [Rhizobium sp. CECT 9324]